MRTVARRALDDMSRIARRWRLPGLLLAMLSFQAFADPPAATDPASAAPPPRVLLSDPQAASTDASAPDSAGDAPAPARRARVISSDRARSAPRPLPPADPTVVLPPVIAPQIRLPAGAPANPGATPARPAAAPSPPAP